MTIKKAITIVLLFLLFITGIRFAWIALLSPAPSPHAVNGQLDLRNWNWEKNGFISLDGEWEFYPKQLIGRKSGLEDAATGGERIISRLPGSPDFVPSTQKKDRYGYASYRLQILLDSDEKQLFTARLLKARGSSAVYANGALVGQSGMPEESKDRYVSSIKPFSATFAPNNGRVDLVIEIANYDLESDYGITMPIAFGTEKKMASRLIINAAMQLIVSMMFAIHFIYAVVLYLIGIRQRSLVVFSLLTLSSCVMFLVDKDRLLFEWIHLNAEWTMRLTRFCYHFDVLLLMLFAKELMAERVPIRWANRLCGAAALFAVLILVLPLKGYFILSSFSWIPFMTSLIFVWSVTLRLVLRSATGAIFLLLSATCLTANSCWGIFDAIFRLNYGFYPLDMLASMISFASFWFMRYHHRSQKLAEVSDKLLREDKRKDLFLANVSHELRNPLHGMLNIAQSVLDTDRRTMRERSAANLELLLSVGSRMTHMINDLLDLTLLKEREVRLRFAAVSVRGMTDVVFDMLRYLLEGKPIRLENRVPDDLPEVKADEGRLVQVVYNLVHNAIKYTREGVIAIEARKTEGRVEIRIVDTGIGIPETERETIFDAYEQGERERQAAEGGIGLGLSLSRRLVELHGGTLGVRSFPGAGSAFFFSLPIADSNDADQDERATVEMEVDTWFEAAAAIAGDGASSDGQPLEPQFSGGSGRILLVDDDPVNRSVLRSILQPEGYELAEASDGPEALRILHSGEWDLIVADVMMPMMSGYQLTRAIRERFAMPELPVLLLTALHRTADRQAGFLAGANDFITKPADASELKMRVRALTGLRRSVKERLRMEAAWLQAQIKPHFLFNTLNAIASLGDFDTLRMRGLLEAFGNYLRASFDFRNSNRLVPLRQELALVRSYLYIEKERFVDRLEVRWDVAEELLRCEVPPLSIQPVVENAVRHGILKLERGGEIWIRVRPDPTSGGVEISVADNGAGMEADKVGSLLESPPDLGHASGIGLWNTDRRLKQIYGVGLLIASEPGSGTTVSFAVDMPITGNGGGKTEAYADRVKAADGGEDWR